MRRLSLVALVCFFTGAALPTLVAAQAQGTNQAAPRAAVPENINEDFELNINERRITEADFQASTAVELGGESADAGISVEIGVAVGASRIDVLLREVRGRVRFRATFDALRRVLDTRRSAAAPAATP